jgi:acetylornithine deacetylase
MTDAVHAAVHAEIDRRQDEIVTFLSDLVRFPSVNRPPRGDELACQQFIEGYYHTMALAVDVFQPDEIPNIEASPGWWPGSDFTDRPNVIGTRRGTGDGRSLLMLAHVDVVPEGPHELWRHGPFNPVVEDGALIGRGSADDKSGIAAQTMALQCLEAAGFRPRGDVIIASVVDEESAGANGTLAALLRPHLADGCVYTDGMQNEIHVAQLGGVNFDIEIQLHPNFAGTTIDHAMEILPAFYQELKQYTAERREKIDADPLYAGGRWPDYAVRMMAFQAGSFDGGNAGASAADHDVRADHAALRGRPKRSLCRRGGRELRTRDRAAGATDRHADERSLPVPVAQPPADANGGDGMRHLGWSGRCA